MKEYATIEQMHEWALCKMVLPPDFVVGEAHNPYLERWWIVPRNRGFHCPNGWVPWQEFTAGENGELVGKGCGE